MSGAGRIKGDGSTDEYLIEVKDARLVHQLRATDLFDLWKLAVKQDKDPLMIIRFSGIVPVVEVSIEIEVK